MRSSLSVLFQLDLLLLLVSNAVTYGLQSASNPSASSLQIELDWSSFNLPIENKFQNLSVTSRASIVSGGHYVFTSRTAPSPSSPRNPQYRHQKEEEGKDLWIYSIDSDTGDLQWTFGDWINSGSDNQKEEVLYRTTATSSGANGADMSPTLAIAGNYNTIIFFRGVYAYLINSTNGHLIWSKGPLPESLQGGYAWAEGDHFFVEGNSEFAVWHQNNGSDVWSFKELWTPSYGSCSPNSKYVALLKQTEEQRKNTHNHSALSGSIHVLHTHNGSLFVEIPLYLSETKGYHPYIFPFFAGHENLFYFTASYVTKVNLSTSAFPSGPGSTIWKAPINFNPNNYGLGEPYVFLYSDTSLVSFNFTTGHQIASIDFARSPLPSGAISFVRVNHLWGFNGFACVGLLYNYSTTTTTTGGSSHDSSSASSKTLMNVTGYNGNDLSVKFTLLASNATSQHAIWGGAVAEGLVVIPLENGVQMIDGSSGQLGHWTGQGIGGGHSSSSWKGAVSTDSVVVPYYTAHPKKGFIGTIYLVAGQGPLALSVKKP